MDGDLDYESLRPITVGKDEYYKAVRKLLEEDE